MNEQEEIKENDYQEEEFLEEEINEQEEIDEYDYQEEEFLEEEVEESEEETEESGIELQSIANFLLTVGIISSIIIFILCLIKGGFFVLIAFITLVVGILGSYITYKLFYTIGDIHEKLVNHISQNENSQEEIDELKD